MSLILIIEDNPEILENIGELLELDGYETILAENGKIGLELAKEHNPDLIISDIMMPLLDGFGVLHLVQKDPQLANTPFIFLTAKNERSDFRKGMDMGADDFITKPFTENELLNAVESRLKKSARLKMAVSSSPEGPHNYEAALRELFKNKTQNVYKKKEIIFREGNYPQFLYYVHSGRVKASKLSDDGKELTVGLYGEGDFMGYTALLVDSGYIVTATAMDDTEVALISRSDFFDIINRNNALTMKFIKMIAQNNNQKAEQMVQLAYNSLRKRVADMIIRLQNKFDKKGGRNFTIKISREEMANLSGTTTESLIRTLSDFKNEKLIEIRGGTIELINEKKLKRMIN